jgi:hypothetical protein
MPFKAVYLDAIHKTAGLSRRLLTSAIRILRNRRVVTLVTNVASKAPNYALSVAGVIDSKSFA